MAHSVRADVFCDTCHPSVVSDEPLDTSCSETSEVSACIEATIAAIAKE